MTSENQKIFQFGSFILDTQRENLYKDGHQINIQRKWYEILCYLIERYGQTVLKEELIEQLWPGKEISDRNLTQHIYSLRRTLGDNPRNPTFILTIPGKGYAFNHPVAILGAAEVETILGIAPSPLIEQPEAPEADDYAQIKSWFTRRRVLQLLLLFLVMTVIVLAFHPSWWRRAATDQPNYPRLATMVTAPGVKVDPSFSPDGKRIAFASGQSVSSLDLFVTTLTQSMAGPLARLTSHPAADHSPVWSPDGRQIAFLRGNHYDQSRMELIVVPMTGGEEKVIANVWGGLDWSPDGRYLVMIDEEDPEYPATPYLITIDGSQRQPITTSVPGEWQFDSHPRFSPDGRSVAFIRWRGDIDGDIWIADIKTQ
ncbi:MAG: hypothetical protein EBU88_14885, partial [Acidobacteria bacterium]|nr:hypothetical protein [Acidobacteriota bacterium]